MNLGLVFHTPFIWLVMQWLIICLVYLSELPIHSLVCGRHQGLDRGMKRQIFQCSHKWASMWSIDTVFLSGEKENNSFKFFDKNKNTKCMTHPTSRADWPLDKITPQRSDTDPQEILFQTFSTPAMVRVRAESELLGFNAELFCSKWIAFNTNSMKELKCMNVISTPMTQKPKFLPTVNPVFHARSKHIDLNCHYVREKVSLGLLHTRHVSIKMQLAGIFTKPLSRFDLEHLQAYSPNCA